MFVVIFFKRHLASARESSEETRNRAWAQTHCGYNAAILVTFPLTVLHLRDEQTHLPADCRARTHRRNASGTLLALCNLCRIAGRDPRQRGIVPPTCAATLFAHAHCAPGVKNVNQTCLGVVRALLAWRSARRRLAKSGVKCLVYKTVKISVLPKKWAGVGVGRASGDRRALFLRLHLHACALQLVVKKAGATSASIRRMTSSGLPCEKTLALSSCLSVFISLSFFTQWRGWRKPARAGHATPLQSDAR